MVAVSRGLEQRLGAGDWGVPAAALHNREHGSGKRRVWFNRTYSTRLDPNEACEVPPAQLLSRSGQRFGHFDQVVQAVAANRRDQQLLGLQIGRPVLQVSRTAYDTDGSALFRSLHRHPGHAAELEISLPTSDQPGGAHIVIESQW